MRYFDFNATSPLREVAKVAMLEAYERFWGNPSTGYRFGAQAKNALEAARVRMAELLQVHAERIVFCSGASEANNSVFREIRRMNGKGSKCCITAVEHPSVKEAAHGIFAENCIEIPVTSDGHIDLIAAERMMDEIQPILISCMALNNETGVLQPWETVAQLCRDRGILFHSDAVQLGGKAAIHQLGDSGMLTLSGHKFGGPRGIGVLVLSNAFPGLSMQFGGAHENSHRAGTENVPGILGMVAALEEAVSENYGSPNARDRFEEKLVANFGEKLVIHGKGAKRIWNTSSISLPDYKSARWVSRLDKAGFAVSSGSACSTGKAGPSPVLKTMGVADDIAARSIRVSSGNTTTEADWLALAFAVVEVYHTLKGESGNSSMVIEL